MRNGRSLRSRCRASLKPFTGAAGVHALAAFAMFGSLVFEPGGPAREQSQG